MCSLCKDNLKEALHSSEVSVAVMLDSLFHYDAVAKSTFCYPQRQWLLSSRHECWLIASIWQRFPLMLLCCLYITEWIHLYRNLYRYDGQMLSAFWPLNLIGMQKNAASSHARFCHVSSLSRINMTDVECGEMLLFLMMMMSFPITLIESY